MNSKRFTTLRSASSAFWIGRGWPLCTFAEIVGPVVAADGRVPEEQEHTVGQGWMPLLSERDDGGIHGVDEHGAPTDDVYFMGIIDILQQCVTPPPRARVLARAGRRASSLHTRARAGSSSCPRAQNPSRTRPRS